jgi:hypothetical protein
VDLPHGALRLVADAVGGEGDGHAQEIRQAIGDRPQAQLRGRFPLRASEMAGEHDGRAMVDRVLDGRQRRADPGVVANHPVLQRHVEVDADEDALALEIQIPD